MYPRTGKGGFMVITGYRIKSTDLSEIEKEIQKVRTRINNIAQKKYQKLVGKEAAFLSDMISTNNIYNDTGGTVFDGAVNSVDNKISNAAAASLSSEYNFHIHAHLLAYEGYTYMKVICKNERFLSAFKVGNIEPFHLSKEEDMDIENAKRKIWLKLHSLYADFDPPVVDLSPVFDRGALELSYPPVDERCRQTAKDAVCNEYLAKISGGGQIPPYLLMPYIHMAEAMLETEDGRDAIAERELQLKDMLVDLNEDDSVIFCTPGDSTPCESGEDIRN